MELLIVASLLDELPVSGGWIDFGLRALAVLIGLLLGWAAIMAAVGVMLVPRPSGQRLALVVERGLHIVFAVISRRARNYAQLDRILAAQGPATVLLFLAFFLVIFVVAFAFIFLGISTSSPLQAVARSGSSMTTLGVNDAPDPAAMIVMIIAAFTGTTVVSVFIGFLLTLYSAFTNRETFMSKLTLLCGDPGWGPELVVRMHKLKLKPDENTVISSIDWICGLRVNQFIYPILNHFRSPVAERHWAITLLAIMDSAAIRLSVVKNEGNLLLARLLAEGANAFHVLRLGEMARVSGRLSEHLSKTWDIEAAVLDAEKDSPHTPNPGISRKQWEHALQFMEKNGVPIVEDREAAWRRFCRLRSFYYENAYYLTHALSAINAPWSGKRHPAVEFPLRWPRLAQAEQHDPEKK